jgi:hypothetical protein
MFSHRGQGSRIPRPIPVELHPHRSEWAQVARQEAERLARAVGPTLLAVEHVGSTAIPRIPAKPILDLIPIFTTLEAADAARPILEQLGCAWGGRIRPAWPSLLHIYRSAHSPPNDAASLLRKWELRNSPPPGLPRLSPRPPGRGRCLRRRKDSLPGTASAGFARVFGLQSGVDMAGGGGGGAMGARLNCRTAGFRTEEHTSAVDQVSEHLCNLGMAWPFPEAHRIDKKKLSALIGMSTVVMQHPHIKNASPKIRRVYERYQRNIGHAFFAARLAPHFVVAAAVYEDNFTKSVFEETGKYPPPSKLNRAQRESVEMRMKRFADSKSPSNTRRTRMKRLYDVLRRVCISYYTPTIDKGFDSIMLSMVILAWTAFESLCEDLLVTAKTLRPKLATPIRPGERPLLPWESAKGNRNTFRTLKGIREHYWRSFGKFRDVHRVLSHRGNDTLAAVRNLIVHRGGIVDKEFLEKVSGIPEFSSAKMEHALHLDFELVRKLIVPAVRRGATLVAGVQRWIDQNP